MKKTLLSMLTLASASVAMAMGNLSPKPIVSDRFEKGPLAPAIEKSVATRGVGAVDFSYAEEPYTAYNFGDAIGGGSRFFAMFEMSPEDIKAYAGNQVTGFDVYSGTNANNRNTITEGRFFYTTDLSSEEYTQKFTMSKTAFAYNQVSLETPYTITGEEKNLYFGYSFVIPKSNDMYYLIVDGEANRYPGSLIIGYSTNGEFPTAFDNTAAAEIGALCMSLKIEGDDLPENMARIRQVSVPPYLPISGEGVGVGFYAKNTSVNDMSSVTVKASVSGMPDLEKTFEFSPVPSGVSTELTFDGIKGDKDSFVDFSLQITKVNGEDFDGAVVDFEVPAYDEGFKKMIVAEDATGTWCGWCPGGIEALEYLKTKYPDRAIAIGVHYGDEMQIDSYMDYIMAYVSGFPNVMYNRVVSQTPTEKYANVCNFIDAVAAYFDYPSYAEVGLEGKSSDDGKTASVTATANFKVATSVPHYLSFVVVEDGVGPYMQNNYFRSQRVSMNGWEKKAEQVATVFNDVARYYDCFPGIENSLPAEITANSHNTYSIDLPLNNVAGNEYRVIALLTNGVTGDIVNACEYNMTKDNTPSAVDGIVDDNAPVEYYNLNGVKVSNPTEGVFIRRQGAKADKVIIK